MSNIYLRIHPAIGIARVGNSDDYYIAPETMAAEPIGNNVIRGGLPIRKGTESDTITSEDIRDTDGKLKKQAARFRIYQYISGDTYSYPSAPEESEEVIVGSEVDGKIVKEIVWTVHLANKKANCWILDEDNGVGAYKDGKVPVLRNPSFQGAEYANPGSENRLKDLVIDAGPRAIKGINATPVKFNEATTPSYANEDGVIQQKGDYPISYPMSDGGSTSYNAASQPIKYLGELETDNKGRLLVLPGYGLACGFTNEGQPNPDAKLDDDVNNNNWLDDAADGPVTAVLIFEGEDGSRAVEGSAWVVGADPAYAPQTLNAVSMWDDVYSNWVENFGLVPELYADGEYKTDYKPSFQDDVFPTFNAAHMQMWNTELNDKAIHAHKRMSELADAPHPGFNILQYMRNPNGSDGGFEKGSPLMPLSLGDAGKSFLTVSTTQYFMLEQWQNGKCVGVPKRELSAGENLDRVMLTNCLGGRYSPGIELTFIVRDPHLYNPNWTDPTIGAFRINAKKLDYSSTSSGKPFLGVGYVPLREAPSTGNIEPGDLSKFMAIPWHTDYNSCAVHLPAPNPGGSLTNSNLYSGTNTLLYWSWPSERPVAVYTFDDLRNSGQEFFGSNGLPTIPQRFSVRGEGTGVKNSEFQHTDPNASYLDAMMKVGRYQDRVNILTNWHKIGIIMQAPAIKGYEGDQKDIYLEAGSQFEEDESNLVQQWRIEADNKVYNPKE